METAYLAAVVCFFVVCVVPEPIYGHLSGTLS